jgi:hypothetical protein
MKRYRINCTSRRVCFPAEDYPLASEVTRDAHLVMYHLSDNPVESVRATLPGLLKHEKAFVLCFKGEMLAGLTHQEELLAQTRQRYPGRVHFLSFAVPREPAAELFTRLEKFGEHARDATDVIDWNVLDPEWPESLLAVYVAMRALAAAEPGSALERALQSNIALRNIIIAATADYRLLYPGSDESLGLGRIDRDSAEQAANKIWRHLKLLKR